MNAFRCIGCLREAIEAGWHFVVLPGDEPARKRAVPPNLPPSVRKVLAHPERAICPQCWEAGGTPATLEEIHKVARHLMTAAKLGPV